MRHLFTILMLSLPFLMTAAPISGPSVDGRWVSNFSGRVITLDGNRRCLEVRGLTTRDRAVRFDRDRRSNRYYDRQGNTIAVYNGSLEYTNVIQRYTEVFERRRRNRWSQRSCPGSNFDKGFNGLVGQWYGRGDGSRIIIDIQRGQLRVRQGKGGAWVYYDRNRLGGFTSRCGNFHLDRTRDYLTLRGPRGRWNRYRR